jgi:hypothetical protein
MSCVSLYNAELAECPETVTIKAHLLADTDYTVVLIDQHGNKFKQSVVSNENGELVIDFESWYPYTSLYFIAGLGAPWTIEVYNAANQQVSFTICTLPYSGFILEFYKGSGINDDVIEGQCAIVSDTSTSSDSYFKKAFTFVTDHYDIPASEHTFSTQIFSIELLAKVSNVWQNIEFIYTIAENNDLSIQSDYDGYDMIIVITGI